MHYGYFIKLLYSLSLQLKILNGFNRQKQENDKQKFWKSVPSYVLDDTSGERKPFCIFSNRWETIKSVFFYRQQTAFT